MATYSNDSATLDLRIRNFWSNGMIVDVALSPVQSVSGWTLSFEYSGDISNIWNARILSRTGDTYVIEAMGYNANVAAGDTVTFGFQGRGNDREITPVSALGDAFGDGQDPAPTPVVSIVDATAREADAVISFDLSLSAVSDQDVVVSYRTVNGSAQSGDDFTPVVGQITIPAGATAATISVDLTDDTTPENTESFVLELVSATGADLGRDQATGTLTDTDTDTDPVDLPAASVAAAQIVEGTPTTTAPELIADGPLSTSGTQIVDADGNPVQIRAVNWFGAENNVRAPHGLWQRPMTDMMDQMVEEGFNAIRLPFSLQNILEDQRATAVGGDPSLSGLTTLEIFDRIVAYAEDIGLKIIFDAHRITQGNGAEGIWYSGPYDEADWIDGWELLANRYGDSSAVIGADLLNEPHLGTWGTGQRNDWAAAAEQAGNAVLDVAPNWLIFVEGIDTYNGNNYWWGGQLQGVRDRPVELDVDNKLVYSPHDYPASVYNQPWFNDGSNLYDVFRENWGFIVEDGIAPIFLGEFGSRLDTASDRAWADAITTYLSGDFDGDGTSDLQSGEVGPSFAWWSWNPNSGDTGGILEDDWVTVRANAADLLAPLLESGTPVDAGPRYLTFTVTLDAPAPEAMTLDYRTEDGTATAGEDYEAQTSTVRFETGEATAEIRIAVQPDDTAEADETFSLILTDAQGTEITAVGTISNDDGTPPDDTGSGDGGSGDDGSGDDTPPVDDGSDALSAELVLRKDWGSGATILLEIENTDEFRFTGGWSVEIKLDPNLISRSWNSNWQENADGTGIIVSDIGWNGNLRANQTIEVGFQLNEGDLDLVQLNADADFLFL